MYLKSVLKPKIKKKWFKDVMTKISSKFRKQECKWLKLRRRKYNYRLKIKMKRLLNTHISTHTHKNM